ncbi:hypothetical protein SAMN05660776_0639 [Salegentibacter holothuriorum]|uniref:Uncharacterized protein n=1 Tax=Salegentibacter holothuriorum TaxID=241145 RepID=A0A1T5AJS7_9FLAO|nr:hypothetical protein [Salegentibacter holothuriorum]SKB35206.1 hypothetical protein SAMN05660776_0639 [Salegentibacter holothuriorum]
MKRYLLLLMLIITSCNFGEQEEVIEYPFSELEISTVEMNKENNALEASSEVKEIESYLKNLSNRELIKGKRLHGADRLCEVILKNNNGNIIIVFKSHKEEGITASFLKENQADNFSHSLGRLYNADHLMELLQKSGLPCG